VLIVATALHHGAPLLTSDSRIGDSGLVQVIG
jgi:predicted nucleic acid-binding protein